MKFGEEMTTQMAAALSSSLLLFSHLDRHFLSHTVRLSPKPHLSLPRAAPPDSSATSGDSSSPPSSETKTSSDRALSLDDLKFKPKNIKRKKKRDKTVIRRDPIQTGVGAPREEKKENEETSGNEGAFLLAWLGLGALILVEGIALAASGFLPDEWDKFFVKFLYPSFTPTVFLFVGLSVAYGVTKYLEAEKMKKS